jgi:hypothetical protein
VRIELSVTREKEKQATEKGDGKSGAGATDDPAEDDENISVMVKNYLIDRGL